MTTALPVRDLQKWYGSKAMALAICISLIFLVLGYKPICRGVVLGAIFSTINFVLMAYSFHSKISPDRKKASLAALYNIFFRYFFMAIPIFIAIKSPRFDLLSTILGLFTVQVVILAHHVYQTFQFSWKKRKKA